MSRPATGAPRVAHVDDDRAAELLQTHFGVTGAMSRLPGDRDQNYLVRDAGDERWVFKIVDPAEPSALVELQNALLLHLAERSPDLGVPRVRRTLGGEPMAWCDEPAGRIGLRVLSYLPGRVLAGVKPRSEELLEGLGALLGRLHLALDGFDDPPTRRSDFDWDLARARSVITGGISALPQGRKREIVAGIALRLPEEESRWSSRLPSGVIHGDANDHNVLVSEEVEGRAIVGLLDFGDLIEGPLVFDLAVAAAYGCLETTDPLRSATAVVSGYHGVRPLVESEADLLWDLIRARLGVSVVLSGSKSETERADPYVSVSEKPAWDALTIMERTHPRLARAVLRDACGFEPVANARAVREWLAGNRSEIGPLVKHELTERNTVVFDVSPSSTDVERLDRVLDAEAFTEVLFERMDDAGVPVGIGRYGEPRLWYASDGYEAGGSEFPERRTVHIAVDLFVRPGEPVMAPIDGSVHSFRNNDERLDYGPTLVLEHSAADGPTFWTLYGHLTESSLDGIERGSAVEKGQEIARVGDYPVNGDWPPHLHFQIITDMLDEEGTFPGVAPPSRMSVWRSISPDPALGLQLPEGSTYLRDFSAADIRELRAKHLGPSLSVSYGEGIHIVRGWRQHLFDSDGQSWLDGVNNVCHVGHGHPRVVEAAARQMAVLNTNTRYLHENVVRYAERLASTLPAPLEVCFFVNSGSEANELALRLARAATGRRDLVVVDSAYHGHTTALIEASPYKFDGPGGAGRIEHVHVAPRPDPYRGEHRSDDPEHALRYAEGVGRALDRAVARGGAAAFIHESILSCGGQIELPPGYLADAYARVRAAGGLCIADEVQVGFGRVGTHFWAFETHGVVPDIVTLGKPIGNGHPLGAVVTTAEIAEAFANGMEYFNTFGGNPVSSAVGMAVLDVIDEEGLQSHALTVGGRLLDGLREVAAEHPEIGDVRGRGLFVGIELVTDPERRTPWAAGASHAVSRMKDHGILLSIDGPEHNVIKVKPPLPFDSADADRLVETLHKVMKEDFWQAG